MKGAFYNKEEDSLSSIESVSAMGNQSPTPFALVEANNPKPKNCRIVLTEHEARAIFQNKPLHGVKDRRRAVLLSTLYGVSVKTIRDIWVGRTWYRSTFHLDPSKPVAFHRLQRKPGRPRGAKDSKPRAAPSPRRTPAPAPHPPRTAPLALPSPVRVTPPAPPEGPGHPPINPPRPTQSPPSPVKTPPLPSAGAPAPASARAPSHRPALASCASVSESGSVWAGLGPASPAFPPPSPRSDSDRADAPPPLTPGIGPCEPSGPGRPGGPGGQGGPDQWDDPFHDDWPYWPADSDADSDGDSDGLVSRLG
jgi:hypothetical protein